MPRRNGSYFGLTVNPTPSVASGIWRVREAEEFLRINKWPATPGVPGSPVGIAGNAQVSLTWSAPTLGSPPTDYQVQYSSNSGSTWTTFADGTSAATSAVVTGLTNDTGYIFRVRAVNALGEGPYGSASGVVTPSALNVALLLHFDGNFTDSSANALTVTAIGDAVTSTATKKYGSGSVQLSGSFSNGTTSGVTAADSVAFGFGTGDFTLEGWFYSDNPSASNHTLFSVGTFQNGVLVRLGGGSNDPVYVNGTAYLYANGHNFPSSQWTHVAVVRNAGTLKVYVAGQEKLSGNASGHIGSSQPLFIGTSGHAFGDADYGPLDAWVGYIDDVRIVKGTAVYTANFTPPTAPF